ncbi:MAG: SRPBCC family protein [Bacteroidota bacterium]
MTTLEVVTRIHATPGACFDLARDVDVHAESLAHAGERVTLRPDHARLRLGDEVEFEGRHLGVRQRLRARITAFDRPHHFRDEQVRGAFRSFVHDHEFVPEADGTRMTDRIRFQAPGGPLGVLVERVILRPYLTRLIARRGRELKHLAETGWRNPRKVFRESPPPSGQDC